MRRHRSRLPKKKADTTHLRLPAGSLPLVWEQWGRWGAHPLGEFPVLCGTFLWWREPVLSIYP